MATYKGRWTRSKTLKPSWTRNGESRKKLLKAVREFRGDIEANRDFFPNYGDRYRHGEKISTGFAESANQVVSKRMVKKQQMRWSESGAHNLSRCGRRCSMTNFGRPSLAGILECKLNRRSKLRRRPPRLAPRFESCESFGTFVGI